MSKDLLASFKITKKRSYSDLPRRTLGGSWHDKIKPGFPSIPQILTEREREEKHSDRGSIFRELADQKGENEGLRKSIQEAMEKVKMERRESYLVKDQLFVVSEDRNKLDKDHRLLNHQYYEMVSRWNTLADSLERCEEERDSAQQELKEIKGRLGNDLKAVDEELQGLRGENERLAEIARDEGLAVERIKVLEVQLRRIKLDKNNYQQVIKRLNEEVREYKVMADSMKPEFQRQIERIKYYQRLVSDLQKKAELYYQKEYELQRELQNKEKEINKVSSSNDSFKKLYEEEEQKHKAKVVELITTVEKLNTTEVKLEEVVIKHEEQIISNEALTVQVQQLTVVTTQKTQEITKLMSHISFLEGHQKSMREAIEQAKLTSAESNKFVQKRDIQVHKLKQEKQYLEKKIDELIQRFRKFDQYYQESSAASKNKLKDSVVAYIKSCSKIEVDMNELRKTLDAKDLEFMEEREMLQRDLQMKEQSLPKNPTLSESIFLEKNEEIRVLENINAQLLKSTVGFKDIVNTFEEQNLRYQQEIKQLNKHIGDLKKLQRENVELKAKERQMESNITQVHKNNKELEERLIKKVEDFHVANDRVRVLEKEISKLLAEVDRLEMKTNMKSPVKEVIIEKPVVSQEDLERTLSLDAKEKSMIEAIDKMSNALQSIQIYFTCGFCDKTVSQPYTVLPCGHNFCQECREGFNEDCFECSNDMPIQGVFKNVYLESALPRVRFLNMVFETVSKLFVKQGEKG